MELKAAIEGIRKSSIGSNITLYTDSKYVKNGITDWIKNWKKNNWMTSSKKPVKNKDLWKELDLLNTNNVNFINNGCEERERGGAIVLTWSYPIMNNVIFKNNTSTYQGGAIYFSSGY